MAYYLRAFCAEGVPTLQVVLNATAAQGVKFTIDPEMPVDPDSPTWAEAALRYSPNRQPLLVEVSRAGDGDQLLAEEVEEFLDALEGVPDSPDKQKVVTALRSAQAVVSLQLRNDVDDEGYDAGGVFLQFFADHCGALVQADAEGFYERDRLIVELD